MIGPGIVVGLAISIVRALRERTRTPRPQPLCEQCGFVHMQYASNGRAEIFCTFGGGVRPVKVDVMYCTDFSQRSVTLPRRPPVGFVLPILEAEPDGAGVLARE
jgi:hypothetical protein